MVEGSADTRVDLTLVALENIAIFNYVQYEEYCVW